MRNGDTDKPKPDSGDRRRKQDGRDDATTLPISSEPQFGHQIGPYHILEKLGEGGMGVVYLAEQREPIKRRVALKIIKLGLDSKEVIGRFESERQALALMNHPGIAKVFDAGATERGRPYFVMEHVPGIAINDYCDRHRLSTEDRLELFIQVCRAVHHAHQKGIIHRDLKPSNVMVTIQDGKPVPKVIDFGVAKATEQRLSELTVYTEQGRLIGTPEYMSPEQAEMTGLNVDTTSDIYSLGVMLYELLTGKLPFERQELMQAGLAKIQRIIREVDPPKPSTKISSIGDEESVLAAGRRKTLPHAWRKQISGELDWITLLAMDKDRTRRYQSASEFGADIERCLRGGEVMAGPPSTRYRLRKLVSRHRGVVAATGLVLATLALGVVVSSHLYLASLTAKNEALWGGYLANIRAAQAFLENNQAIEARSRLDACAEDLRGWEWRHLNLHLNSHVKEIPLLGPIEHVVVSPQASRFATVDTSGQFVVRDLDSGTPICSFTENRYEIQRSALAPDGSMYVDNGMVDGGLLQVVSIDLCQTLVSIDPCSDGTDYILIAPDGGTLATSTIQSVTYDRGTSIIDGRLCLWSLPDGQLTASRQDTSMTFALDFSPDSSQLAVCSAMGVVGLVDGRTGAGLRTIAEDCYYNARFSRDGRLIAIAGFDKTIRIVSVDSGEVLSTIPAIGSDPASLDFGHDSALLAVAYDGGTICLWDTDSKEKLATYHDGQGIGVGFNADATQMVSWPQQAYLAPGRQQVIRTWDPFAGTTQHLPGTGGSALVFSPDGRRLYSGSGIGAIDARGTSHQCAVREWDTESGELCAVWRGHHGLVNELSITPDGEQVTSISEDGTVRVWEAVLGTGRRIFEPDSATLVSADGRWLAVGKDDSLVVRDARTLEISRVLPLAGSVEDGFVFASAGDLLAAGRGPELKVWRSASGKQVSDLQIPSSKLNCLAFSPDGRRLAVGTREGSIYIVDIGSEFSSLSDHRDPIEAIAWHPDGRRIASGSWLGIRIWDVDTGDLLAILSSEPCEALAFSPDGRTLAGQRKDRITLWRTASVKEGARARCEYRLARRQTEPLLDRLFDRYQFADDVAQYIIRDSALADDLREYALRAVRVRGGDPEALELASWPSALVPGADQSRYSQALKTVSAACELNPLHPTFFRTKGALQYRLGQLEQARSSLVRADSLGTFLWLGSPGHPTTVAFLAMVLHDMGLAAESEEMLQRLEVLMATSQYAEDVECRRLYVEACEQKRGR